jgi:hypothetical protein
MQGFLYFSGCWFNQYFADALLLYQQLFMKCSMARLAVAAYPPGSVLLNQHAFSSLWSIYTLCKAQPTANTY